MLPTVKGYSSFSTSLGTMLFLADLAAGRLPLGDPDSRAPTKAPRTKEGVGKWVHVYPCVSCQGQAP